MKFIKFLKVRNHILFKMFHKYFPHITFLFFYMFYDFIIAESQILSYIGQNFSGLWAYFSLIVFLIFRIYEIIFLVNIVKNKIKSYDYMKNFFHIIIDGSSLWICHFLLLYLQELYFFCFQVCYHQGCF